MVIKVPKVLRADQKISFKGDRKIGDAIPDRFGDPEWKVVAFFEEADYQDSCLCELIKMEKENHEIQPTMPDTQTP